MSPTIRFAVYWAVFTLWFIVLQLVIAKEAPNAFGVAVIVAGALVTTTFVRWIEQRGG